MFKLRHCMDATLKGTPLLLLLLLSITMASQVDQAALEAVAKGNTAFATSLYKLLRQEGGNVFFSPISIEVVLALAYTGAGGNTARQMAAALHLPEERAVLESGFHTLMSTLKSTDSMTLEIANKIFGQQKYPFKDSFKAVAEKSFLSAAQELDFVSDPKGSRNVINRWVEERTHNKITNLIPDGVINSLTRLVLVNAIYFKGKWKYQFDAAMTYPQPFHTSAKEKKDVPMMHIKKKFGYAEREDLQSKVLVMPYQGDQISMVILLPNEIDGLANLENKLDGLDMAELIKAVDHVEVEVTLPSFKLETTIDLNDSLQKLGMVDMFDQQSANFSGISTADGGLYVSNVLQKAFIEVNEEGSEAAAATAAIKKRKAKRILHQCIFKADHPFLFMLTSYLDSNLLFMGQLQTPEE